MQKVIFAALVAMMLTGCIEKRQVISQQQKAVPSQTQLPTKQILGTQTTKSKSTPITIQKNPTTIKHTPSAREVIATPIESSDTLTLPTLNGGAIRVNASGLNMEFLNPSYSGKNVLIFMFGYDCPHCLREMPTIKKLQNNPNLKIIGVHAKSMIGDDRLRSFARSKGLNFDILSFKNDIKLIRFLREGGYFEDEVPTNILVHPDGTLEVVYPEQLSQKL